MSYFQIKKSLGQHLLIDSHIINQIISYAPDIKKTNIIEVGPGTGNLTRAILGYQPPYLLAIEKDQTTQAFLDKLKTKHPTNFDYIIDDALKFNYLDLVKSKSATWAVISNLPYNVGTALFVNWLKANLFSYYLLMFQKEVALRITAELGSPHYGKLSLFTKIFGEAQLLFEVEPEYFSPPPKVQSAVILFKPYVTPISVNLDKFEKLTNAVFNQRRKMLRQSLKQLDINLSKITLDLSLRQKTYH